MNRSPDSYEDEDGPQGGLEMTQTVNTSRAVVAGLLWFAVSAALSGGRNLMNSGMTGATMGAAVLGNGLVHSALSVAPSQTSSALATGGIFAGLQMVRGDANLVVNGLSGAGTDFVTEYVGDMLGYTA
jgi:hypothetical protein